MHPHIPRPRRKATRTCTDTAGVVRTVHGEFMWPFTARVNEKTAPIERIAAVAICRRLPPRCASQQNRTFNVALGHKRTHAVHQPMSALPPLVDNWNVINCIYADGPMAFCIFPAVAGGAKKRFQVNSQVNKTPILLKP